MRQYVLPERTGTYPAALERGACLRCPERECANTSYRKERERTRPLWRGVPASDVRRGNAPIRPTGKNGNVPGRSGEGCLPPMSGEGTRQYVLPERTGTYPAALERGACLRCPERERANT